MYMQAYFASSFIILYACMHMPYYPDHEALSHYGYGHGLTSVAQLYVVNIADIRSAFIETLASERFRRNIVDDAPSREACRRRASLLVLHKHSCWQWLAKTGDIDLLTYIVAL